MYNNAKYNSHNPYDNQNLPHSMSNNFDPSLNLRYNELARKNHEKQRRFLLTILESIHKRVKETNCFGISESINNIKDILQHGIRMHSQNQFNVSFFKILYQTVDFDKLNEVNELINSKIEKFTEKTKNTTKDSFKTDYERFLIEPQTRELREQNRENLHKISTRLVTNLKRMISNMTKNCKFFLAQYHVVGEFCAMISSEKISQRLGLDANFGNDEFLLEIINKIDTELKQIKRIILKSMYSLCDYSLPVIHCLVNKIIENKGLAFVEFAGQLTTYYKGNIEEQLQCDSKKENERKDIDSNGIDNETKEIKEGKDTDDFFHSCQAIIITIEYLAFMGDYNIHLKSYNKKYGPQNGIKVKKLINLEELDRELQISLVKKDKNLVEQMQREKIYQIDNDSPFFRSKNEYLILTFFSSMLVMWYTVMSIKCVEKLDQNDRNAKNPNDNNPNDKWKGMNTCREYIDKIFNKNSDNNSTNIILSDQFDHVKAYLRRMTNGGLKNDIECQYESIDSCCYFGKVIRVR